MSPGRSRNAAEPAGFAGTPSRPIVESPGQILRARKVPPSWAHPSRPRFRVPVPVGRPGARSTRSQEPAIPRASLRPGRPAARQRRTRRPRPTRPRTWEQTTEEPPARRTRARRIVGLWRASPAAVGRSSGAHPQVLGRNPEGGLFISPTLRLPRPPRLAPATPCGSALAIRFASYELAAPPRAIPSRQPRRLSPGTHP